MENATLTKTSLNWLYDAARWSRFIAILGFILTGFLVIGGIFTSTLLTVLNEDIGVVSGNEALPKATIAVIYIVIAVVYFFPIYYLFRFSNGFIKAYKTEDEYLLNSSLQFLKKHYQFIGILVIVLLALYIIIFAISMFAGFAGLF